MTLLGEDTILAPTAESPTWTHNLPGNVKLYYRLAATNRWGTGPYSRPNLEIPVAREPDQILNVKINTSGPVRITFDVPVVSGASSIEKYEVNIKDN